MTPMEIGNREHIAGKSWTLSSRIPTKQCPAISFFIASFHIRDQAYVSSWGTKDLVLLCLTPNCSSPLPHCAPQGFGGKGLGYGRGGRRDPSFVGMTHEDGCRLWPEW